MSPTRIDKDVDIDLPGVVLNRSDVEYLINRLADGMKSVKLASGELVYDDVSDMIANSVRRPLNELSITVTSPKHDTLWTHIRPGSVRLHGSSALLDRATGVAHFLRSKSPWYCWQPGNAWWWHSLSFAALLGLGVAAALAVPVLLWLPPPWAQALIGLAIGALPMSMLFSGRVYFGKSRVDLRATDTSPTFWERNRDAVVLAVLTNLLTGLIGFAVGRLS